MAIKIKMTQKGDFSKTFHFLKAAKEKAWIKKLPTYAQQGVDALKEATPKDTGLTANSWAYDISDDGKQLTITWYNTNVKKGYFNVALMLQYGHGTRGGGWVEGIDYINPALAPVFEKISANIWNDIKKS